MTRTTIPLTACVTLGLACAQGAFAQPVPNPFEAQVEGAVKSFKRGVSPSDAQFPKLQAKEIPELQKRPSAAARGGAAVMDQAMVDMVGQVMPSVILVKTESGLGSGFIIDSAGLAVTNAHVVEGAEPGEMVAVVTNDKRAFPAVVLAVGPLSRRGKDIALLGLPQGSYSALRFAAAKDVAPGRSVIAVGHPKGLAFSVSQGIVSAVERRMPGSVMTYVQTCTPINPGNSGGPLVSLDGKVVGMNTEIMSESGGSEGLGFAISAADIEMAIQQFKRTGDLKVGYMGAPMLPDAEHNTVVLQDVARGGPAEKAGLKQGDSIVEIDGQAVASSPADAAGKILRTLAFKSPGEKVKVAVIRDAKRVDATVTLADWPEPSIMASAEVPSARPMRVAVLGNY